MKKTIITVLLVISLAIPFTTHATDGVIEINQAKVTAAGGFPYVISQPGSYRLTSNLTTTDPSKNAIEIGASNVNLDLNGFAIIGPTTCTLSASGTVASCSPAGMGNGVTLTQTAQNMGGLSSVRIINGTITGMAYVGIYLPYSTPVVIENIRAVGNGSTGISIGGGSTMNYGKILNSISERNGNNGFELMHGLAEGCESRLNKTFGMAVNRSGVVSHTALSNNGSHGLYVFPTTDTHVEISHNAIVNNGGAGIHFTGTAGDKSSVAVNSNTIANNTGIGADIHQGTLIGNDIGWNGGVGLNTNYAVSMKDNNFQGNNGGGVQTSGSVLYNGGGNMCGPAACP